MQLLRVPLAELRIEPDLARRASAKRFLHLLEASIREIGLAEPLKVAQSPKGGYIVIDGVLRLTVLRRLAREGLPGVDIVPVLAYPYKRRFELRYQTDIFQDLLPSQLASLVEHLHSKEAVSKNEIASSLGVAPATLRNYTGLWRLSSRGGLCAAVVGLMDIGVLPSSNPFAWLRLTDEGVRQALERSFSSGTPASEWIDRMHELALDSRPTFAVTYVEDATGSLEEMFYRVSGDVRVRKQAIGRRKASGDQPRLDEGDGAEDRARDHLARVASSSPSAVLQVAARNLTSRLWG